LILAGPGVPSTIHLLSRGEDRHGRILDRRVTANAASTCAQATRALRHLPLPIFPCRSATSLSAANAEHARGAVTHSSACACTTTVHATLPSCCHIAGVPPHDLCLNTLLPPSHCPAAFAVPRLTQHNIADPGRGGGKQEGGLERKDRQAGPHHSPWALHGQKGREKKERRKRKIRLCRRA